MTYVKLHEQTCRIVQVELLEAASPHIKLTKHTSEIYTKQHITVHAHAWERNAIFIAKAVLMRCKIRFFFCFFFFFFSSKKPRRCQCNLMKRRLVACCCLLQARAGFPQARSPYRPIGFQV